MGWIAFIAGLILGVILAGGFLLGWLVYVLLPHHRSIRSPKQLQQALIAFLKEGKHREYRFIFQPPDGLMVRVIKYVRKTMPDALVVEVRRSENQAHYAALCADLQRRGIVYEERFTPQRNEPKLFRMKFDGEAARTVASTSHAISVMCEALCGTARLDLKIGEVPP